ncbi:hypothetical protein [Komagataeibacter sp. FNDCR2]|uniref:hypothetical protein n=1 Tax=Komagataeibacter sp. FNDCR2 TaxID=2878682 RepID=UPI001E5569B5|nr:hypothetical protein [Komagataeibacter sp. FNDCR2]MCE2576737.1 hypothetical protein [Komagataeibacter sp. FNDCR2]
MARRSLRRPVPVPYARMNEKDRELARGMILAHVRNALVAGPHAVLELRKGLPVEALGAFPIVLDEMVEAGEIASMGHSVYARVPWMPATRKVVASPVKDMVFAALSELAREGSLPEELAENLVLPLKTVQRALVDLEGEGMIHESRIPGRYRPVSRRMASHVRRGAAGRVFADVLSHA